MTRIYQFGRLRLDTARRALHRDDEPVRVAPKAIDLLIFLIENRHRLVTKEELLKGLWPDRFVEENNLAQAISAIRKVLDAADAARFVVTVPGHGYRFDGPITEIGAEPESLVIRQRTRTRIVLEETSAESALPIAVLPFRWISPPAGDEYLGLGISDGLITRLARVPQLFVRPTSAVAPYTRQIVDPTSAARALRVPVLLEGTLQRNDTRILLNLQLVRADGPAALWGEAIQFSADELPSVEASIAKRVLNALGVEIPASLPAVRSGSPEVNRLYMRGVFLLNCGFAERAQQALAAFEQCIRIDNTFARGHAAVAKAHCALGFMPVLRPPGEEFEAARAAARSAIERDGELADAFVALGIISFHHDWDWRGAERSFRHAIELSANDPDAHHGLSQFLLAMGRLDNAISELSAAQELDPVSPMISMHLALALMAAGRFNEALAQFNATLELQPHFGGAHALLGWTYEAMGDYARAIEELQRAKELDPAPAGRDLNLARVHALRGERDRAEQLLRSATAAGNGFVPPVSLAEVYAVLGDYDRAFEQLERGIAQRDSQMAYTLINFRLGDLRNDARFSAILHRLRLSDASAAAAGQ